MGWARQSAAFLARVLTAIVIAVLLAFAARSIPDWALVVVFIFALFGLELKAHMDAKAAAIRKDTRRLADAMYILDPHDTIRLEAESARVGRIIRWAEDCAEELNGKKTAEERRLYKNDLKSALRELKEIRGRERFYVANARVYVETPGGPLELHWYQCEDCKREDHHLFFDHEYVLERHCERLHHRNGLRTSAK